MQLPEYEEPWHLRLVAAEPSDVHPHPWKVDVLINLLDETDPRACDQFEGVPNG